MSDHKNIRSQAEDDLARTGDLALSGYALLRLSPRSWRSIARRLAAPASRLHKLRNTRTRMWRLAVGRLDCHECRTG